MKPRRSSVRTDSALRTGKGADGRRVLATIRQRGTSSTKTSPQNSDHSVLRSDRTTQETLTVCGKVKPAQSYSCQLLENVHDHPVYSSLGQLPAKSYGYIECRADLDEEVTILNFEVADFANFVKVTGVDQNSPASAVFRVGDRVLAINGQRVFDSEHCRSLMATAGRFISILVARPVVVTGQLPLEAATAPILPPSQPSSLYLPLRSPTADLSGWSRASRSVLPMPATVEEMLSRGLDVVLGAWKKESAKSGDGKESTYAAGTATKASSCSGKEADSQAVDQQQTPMEQAKCSADYLTILKAVKCDARAKCLASQLIVRYFNDFLDLSEKSLDAMFELCEDDDINIRKFVIKELPSFAKFPGNHVPKIADVLVQLLQTDDAQEQQLVQMALCSLLAQRTKETLATIFGHILTAEEEVIRERAIKFLAIKLKTLPDTVMTKELEEYVLQQSHQVLQDVTGDEFIMFIHILSQLKHLQTLSGRQLLLDIVVEQADLDKTFDSQDPDRVDQIVQCMKQAIPFLSRNVPSTSFVNFILMNVMPVLDTVKSDSSNIQLEILRIASDLMPYCGELENADEKTKNVFSLLMMYLPALPSEFDSSVDTEKEMEEPKIQFSEVECLIWIFYQLAKRYPKFVNTVSISEEFKEFRKRLQYLARVIQVYSQSLRKLLSAKTTEVDEEKKQFRVMALRTTSNILTLTRDLLHNPPLYKAIVVPSWKSERAKQPRQNAEVAETENVPKKIPRKEVSYYEPPGGKFSSKAGSFEKGSGFRKTWRNRY